MYAQGFFTHEIHLHHDITLLAAVTISAVVQWMIRSIIDECQWLLLAVPKGLRASDSAGNKLH